MTLVETECHPLAFRVRPIGPVQPPVGTPLEGHMGVQFFPPFIRNPSNTTEAHTLTNPSPPTPLTRAGIGEERQGLCSGGCSPPSLREVPSSPSFHRLLCCLMAVGLGRSLPLICVVGIRARAGRPPACSMTRQ